ncbi:MAG: hydrolase [Chloroflexota bacterium]
MLQQNNTALLVIDVQNRLAQVMNEKEALLTNLERLIQGAQLLGLPILWTEQVPEKLGPTVPTLNELLSESNEPISKHTFSCCRNETFTAQLEALNCKNILVTGIETHICVYQTCLDLLETNHEIQLVVDAVASRTDANKTLGIQRLSTAGATLTSTEMALFELLGDAKDPQFRAISKLIK